jgi:uncharacterized membrane protein
MDWMLFGIQWLHVLAGITWFGASLTTNFIFVPAIGRLPLSEQRRVGAAYGQAANRLLRPTATLVILLGILRGTVFGQLKSLDDVLGTAYGLTWLVSLIVAVLTFAWAEAAIAPNIAKLNSLEQPLDADGNPTPEMAGLLAKAKRNALLEMIGFVTVFTCMILMRFGY